MVATKKFSEFFDAGDMPNNSISVGYGSNLNQKYNNPWTFMASGTTGDRPTPSPSIYYRQRFNTTLLQYEFYDPAIPGWVQLGDNTTGVSSIEGTQNQVLVNGTFGSPVTGNLVLTLPQDIDPTSSPTFFGLTLGTPLSPAFGGTGVGNDPANTITLGGSLTLNGTFSAIFNIIGATNITFPTSGTLATTGMIPSFPLSIANGGTSSTSVIFAPTAGSWAGWDGYANMSANNFISGYTTTVTSGSTTILTVDSAYQQYFSGTLAHTVQMPDVTTLTLGQSWLVVNNSSNTVTVTSSGGNTIVAMAANTQAVFTCVSLTGTTAASWESDYSFSSGSIASILGTTNQINVSIVGNVATISSPIIGDSGNFTKNLIIGGDFGTNPWQRGTSFAGVTSGSYSADRWKTSFLGTAVVTNSLSNDAPSVVDTGIFSTGSHLTTVTTAQAIIGAGDIFYIHQIIEGYNFTRIAQRTFTAQFRVKSNLPGTYCIFFQMPGAYTYVHEYTINAANTWEYKTVTVSPSPVSGLANYTSGQGLFVGFTLACGSNFQTTSGSWQAGTFSATSNQINFLATVGNTFQFDLVQLEPGSFATPFEIQTRQQVLTACQRYYTKTFPISTAPAQNVGSYVGCVTYRCQVAGTAGANGSPWIFPVNMRATPTITTYNPSAANALWRNASGGGADSGAAVPINTANNLVWIGNAQAAGDAVTNVLNIHATANAEL